MTREGCGDLLNYGYLFCLFETIRYIMFIHIISPHQHF